MHMPDKEYILDTCYAILNNEKLALSIKAKTNSLPDFVIHIDESNKEREIMIDENFVVTDCMFVNAVFKILDPEMVLPRKSYVTGDTVQGELKLRVAGYKSYFKEIGETTVRNNWDTFPVTGKFKAIVNRF